MSRPAKRDDGIPTRVDIRFDTDAERLCRITLGLVESMGASVSLTRAVIALSEARNHIADHVEGTAAPADQPEPPTPEAITEVWEAAVLATPGAPERVAEIAAELRAATKPQRATEQQQ